MRLSDSGARSSSEILAERSAARERLREWVANLNFNRSAVAIEYAEVDMELNFVPGTSKRLLAQSIPRTLPAASHSSGWYLVEERDETFMVRFKLPQEEP